MSVSCVCIIVKMFYMLKYNMYLSKVTHNNVFAKISATWNNNITIYLIFTFHLFNVFLKSN